MKVLLAPAPASAEGGFKEYLDPRYLEKYIQRLREKLKDDPSNPQMLLTECGVGYKFIRPR